MPRLESIRCVGLRKRYQLVAAVAVAAVGFKVAELGELAQVAFGGGGGETEMADNFLGGE